MKEEPQNKCKEQNFVHAWRDITPNIAYTTYTPQYPPKKEQCQNCGLTRTHCSKVERWFEYKIEPTFQVGTSSVTIQSIVENGMTANVPIANKTFYKY